MRTRDYDKQARIKEAMIDLILKEGINGASVAKIAKKANVSPATILKTSTGAPRSRRRPKATRRQEKSARNI